MPLALALVAALLAGCSDDAGVAPSPPGSTVYVDVTAPAGGDGSAARPFQTMAEALERDPAPEKIVVAAGDYPVPAWTFAQTLSIAGADTGTTRLSADGSERIAWSVTDSLSVSQIELASPLDVAGGTLALDKVRATGVAGPALALDAVDATLTDVDVADLTAGDGVDAKGGTLSYTGGTLSGAPDRALVLRGGNADLAGLKLSGGDRAPLTVIEGATTNAADLTIEDMRIGVFVDGATLTLADSTIARAAITCVLAGPESDLALTDSSLSDCPDSHVALIGMGAKLSLERNDIHGAVNSPCVTATNTDGAILVRDNTISDCAGDAISVSDAHDVTIEGNTMSKIVLDPVFGIADGVTVLDSTITIRENTLFDVAGAGLHLIRTAATAAGNVIGPVDGAGIAVIEPGSARSLLKGNKITKAKATGVIVIDASADILDNDISGTKFVSAEGLGDGIAFGQGADVTIEGNTLSKNGANGVVFLDGARGTIEGNTFTENLLYGIREHCTAPPNMVTIGANTFMQNGAGDTNLCSP